MADQKMKLGCPDVAAVIDQPYAKEPDSWRENRLLAMRFVAKSKFTSAEIADLCGVARGYLFEWIKAVRAGGTDALLTREKPGSIGEMGEPRRLPQRMSIVDLPTYSPQLNPCVAVWIVLVILVLL
jgi:hypothetical protein